MCRATNPDAVSAPPRRAATRVAHVCRGRGGRGCRCHVASRPYLALAQLVTPPVLVPAVLCQLQHAPRRPQGPPLSV